VTSFDIPPGLPQLGYHDSILVPIQMCFPPRNVHFEITDITGILPFEDASVDVVHTRMTCLQVHSSESHCLSTS
jgi:hypothetical protein